jgi:hypothetical protein
MKNIVTIKERLAEAKDDFKHYFQEFEAARKDMLKASAKVQMLRTQLANGEQEKIDLQEMVKAKVSAKLSAEKRLALAKDVCRYFVVRHEATWRPFYYCDKLFTRTTVPAPKGSHVHGFRWTKAEMKAYRAEGSHVVMQGRKRVKITRTLRGWSLKPELALTPEGLALLRSLANKETGGVRIKGNKHTPWRNGRTTPQRFLFYV